MKRVWAYVIGKELSQEKLHEFSELGRTFVSSWTAHDNQLSASFGIFKDRIILIAIDEQVYGASGCSIDKLQRFIREMETKFNVELFNRFLVATKNEEKIRVINAQELPSLLRSGIVKEDTIVYNTSISTKDEFEQWEQPLHNTWLKGYLIKA
jgi:hypothetical protein